eukprot:1156737-Pelagomonas_calceolata.AAC.8
MYSNTTPGPCAATQPLACMQQHNFWLKYRTKSSGSSAGTRHLAHVKQHTCYLIQFYVDHSQQHFALHCMGVATHFSHSTRNGTACMPWLTSLKFLDALLSKGSRPNIRSPTRRTSGLGSSARRMSS